MNIKIKFEPFKEKNIISMNNGPLPRFSALNNYVNMPLLDMAPSLLREIIEELNDNFTLTVIGTDFERNFLKDFAENFFERNENSMYCEKVLFEDYDVPLNLKETLNETLQMANQAAINVDEKIKVYADIDIFLDTSLAFCVETPKEANLCVVSDLSQAEEVLGLIDGKLVVCLAERNQVIFDEEKNKYIWNATEDKLFEVVNSIIERVVIPAYVERVSVNANKTGDTKLQEQIEKTHQTENLIEVELPKEIYEGDVILPQYTISGNENSSVHVRLESTNMNVIEVASEKKNSVEIYKLKAVHAGDSEIRFYRQSEIEPFKMIALHVKSDELVKDIKLNVPERIKVGQTFQIKADYIPASAPDIKQAIWSTSNSDVLEVVDADTYLAKAVGVATVTVATERITKSIDVTVLPRVKEITLSEQSLELKIGTKRTIAVDVNPNIDEKIHAKSSNVKVAEVSLNEIGEWEIKAKGIIANGKGQCKVLFETEDGECKAVCEVMVVSTLGTKSKNGSYLSRTALFTVFAFVLQFFTKPLGYFGGIGCGVIAVILGVIGIGKYRKDAFWQITLMIISILIILLNLALFIASR